MYISFNTRDIVYECKCGKRKIERETRSFSDPFPIKTTLITRKELEKIQKHERKADIVHNCKIS